MGALRPIELAVKRQAWRVEGEFESNHADWRSIRAGILERDRHSCAYCDFSAPKYQEVHHLNGDHADNRPENLITTCALCHATQHVGLAGRFGRGHLIWLPEIDQATLNHLVRWLELGPYQDADMGAYVSAPKENLRRFFEQRKTVCAAQFGSSSALDLGQILLDMDDHFYQQQARLRLGPVRLYPVLSGYPAEVTEVWRQQLKLIVPEPTKIPVYLEAGKQKS